MTSPDRAGDSRPGRPRPDRERLDRVFGETLPERGPDDRLEGRGGFDEDFWREQRPPHHG